MKGRDAIGVARGTIEPINVYVVLVVLAAVAAAVGLIARFGPPMAVAAGLFLVLSVAAESLKLEVPFGPAGTVGGMRRRQPALSAGFLVLLTAALATDPSTALVVGAGSAWSPKPWRGALRAMFNSAQAALYTGGASLVFHELGGPTHGVWWALAATLAASSVAVAANTGFVAGAVAIDRGWPVSRALRMLLWPTPFTVSLALPAFVIALLYRSVGGLGPLAAAFVITILLVLRQARAGKVGLDEARDRTLRAFVRAVELKDPYTRRHSERVAEIALELHRELGTPDTDLERRYYAALLHDIGKVAVPARILTKPGRLTPEEFEAVKRHPELGAATVASIGFLSSLAPEILEHHERVDGGGYPHGLRGEEITFEGRVLAVADTFEALTSRRPYRSAFRDEDAVRELVRSSGSQLDPEVVAALRRLLAKGSLLPAEREIPAAPVAHLPGPGSAAQA